MQSDKAAGSANEEVPAEKDSRQIENCCTNEEDVIAQKVKSAVTELATNELSSMFEELQDNTLRTLFHNAQRGMRQVVYDVVEQLILDLVRKDVIEEKLNAHLAIFSMLIQPLRVLEEVAIRQVVHSAYCDFCLA